ncbi:sulfotransferase [Aliivibrio fischeri]|uniref:sulfotransferase n=1 Tax=Aliivibrio fischeri TaxID=668 RepID=UPI0012DAB629|nr:sulfotransferase [Aliivibrio fischeri]MUL16615.1 hypothetical protein [Aliivibrio fischeri]
MLINIDGWFGGGKSVLWSLLDGHSEIFVDPVHDYSFEPFLSLDINNEWLEKKHTSSLRKFLSHSEYYKLEKMMYDKYLPIHFSASHTLNIKYKLDFYSFDNALFDNLEKLNEWSPESIAFNLYSTLDYKWNDTLDSNRKYYASMGKADSYVYYHKIPKVFPNMKSIVVRRTVENIIATRTNRKERATDLNSLGVFRADFTKLVKSGEIEKICDYFKVIENLESQYPDKFLLIEFHDLIKNTEKEMYKVSKFLNVKFEDILVLPTRDGVILEDNDVSFIGEENDKAVDLFSKSELDKIKLHMKLYSLHGMPCNIFSLKSIFLYVFPIIKNKIIKRINK